MNESVCAVIVTYNRKVLLRQCLRCVLSQERSVDSILVVNNASTDGTEAMLQSEFPTVNVLTLTENIGGSGGFYEGIKWAYEKGYDWIWIMDDDCKPLPDCLSKLMNYTEHASVLVPIQRDSANREYGVGYWKGRYVDGSWSKNVTSRAFKIEIFTFVGPLIRSSIIEKVGLPLKEFFISADDWNYALRIKEAGLQVLAIKEAVILHEYGGKTIERTRLGRKSYRGTQPTWKYYYATRNLLFTICHLQNEKEKLKSTIWFIFNLLRYITGDLIYEPERWGAKTKFRVMGLIDALRGRLGRTVRPEG